MANVYNTLGDAAPALGAAVGSVIPGVGTVIGGALGTAASMGLKYLGGQQDDAAARNAARGRMAMVNGVYTKQPTPKEQSWGDWGRDKVAYGAGQLLLGGLPGMAAGYLAKKTGLDRPLTQAYDWTRNLFNEGGYVSSHPHYNHGEDIPAQHQYDNGGWVNHLFPEYYMKQGANAINGVTNWLNNQGWFNSGKYEANNQAQPTFQQPMFQNQLQNVPQGTFPQFAANGGMQSVANKQPQMNNFNPMAFRP